jgi:hypothetical protein
MHWIDPQSLPAVHGTIKQFLMNRHGELDGLLLMTADGQTRLVHFPPHMSGEVESAINVGDAITVHGVKPRGANVIAAVSLVAANGTAIVDAGPDAPRVEVVPAADGAVRRDAAAAGTVRLSLYGPKGELRGAVLEDGTAIRVGKKEASAFADVLKPGAALVARGAAIVCRHGSMIDAEAIGADAGHLRPVKNKKEEEPKKPKKHTEDGAHVDA